MEMLIGAIIFAVGALFGAGLYGAGKRGGA